MSELTCEVCFRHCRLKEGAVGFCRARKNENGVNVPANYGRITGLAMDPIEKKPLARFHPGSWILSCGFYGCNLACPFCQNYSISMSDETTADYETVSAERLADLILNAKNNLGIAFTYNEMMISYEYILDVAGRIRPHGKKVVLVSNGCVSEPIVHKLLPVIDAANIDLKGDREFYRELSGDYDSVKNTIALLSSSCHVEVTTLVIPGKNDRLDWIREEARWLASLNPDLPLHLSRYFPRYRYTIPPTPAETIFAMKEAAEEYLRYVYTGNL